MLVSGSHLRRIIRDGRVWACLLVSFANMVQAQSASTQLAPRPPLMQGASTEVSLPHLYWHFLMYQRHLDSTAAEREKQGKGGGWLRDHVAQRLDFTDSEFTPVRESSMRLEKALAEIDAKAMAIVTADHGPHSKLIVSADVRTAHLEQLRQLNQERETAIVDEITRLNDALGPDDAAKLKDYVQKEFSPKVTANTLHPNLRIPHKTTAQAVPQGVQR